MAFKAVDVCMLIVMSSEGLSKEEIEWKKGPFFNERNKETGGRASISEFPCLLLLDVNLLSKQRVQFNPDKTWEGSRQSVARNSGGLWWRFWTPCITSWFIAIISLLIFSETKKIYNTILSTWNTIATFLLHCSLIITIYFYRW